MDGAGMSSVGRVNLVDLIAADGLPSDRHKHSVATLSQSLARYNAAIIQLPLGDAVLMKCVLDSGRMFFHQKLIPGPEMVHTGNPEDWNGSSGYFAHPQHWSQMYDYRPGQTPEPSSGTEVSPAGLPELFSALGKVSRHILDAIGCSLGLQSFCFTDFLDNMPLKAGEVSSSVLSLYCYRSSVDHGVHQGATRLVGQDQSYMQILDDHKPQADKSLLTLVKSDKAGLHIRDMEGHWLLVDDSLSPQDLVVYTGLSLYQATAGCLSPALHRIEVNNLHWHMYGRCSLAFKLMPRATAILHCSAMTAAGHAVGGPFQQPITVYDFMQRTHPMDQLMSQSSLPNFIFPSLTGGAMKGCLKRRKQNSRGKPLAPSKRLRLEAQRVLKEKVQEIADSKNIKIRFCSLKECEEHHITSLGSPCAATRVEIGWPSGVPFVHPHDLPNKAKQAFLETYEPGWSASQDPEFGLIESGHGYSLSHACKPDCCYSSDQAIH